MKKKITISLIILLIFFLFVIGTEIYLKKIGLGKPVIYEHDNAYGYAPKSNQKTVRFSGSIVTINESGLRTIKNWEEHDGKKIIFFGDSVTYGGSYVDDKDTFVHLVCQNIINQDLVCGNAAVNAYGILNMVYRSRYDERIQDSNYVIFIVITDDFVRGLQNSKTAHFYMNQNLSFIPAIMEAINFISYKYDIRKYISKKKTNSSRHLYEAANIAINNLREEVYRIQNLEKNVLVVFSPTKNAVNTKDQLTNHIIKNLMNFGVPFLNLSSVLTKDNLFYDDVHLSKKGHLIVGEKLSQYISKIILDVK